MMRKKEVIDQRIFELTQNGSVEVQFSVEVSLMKHGIAEQEETTFEKIMFYLNVAWKKENFMK